MDAGAPASGVGAQIKGANGEVWGLVVADAGKVWQLEGGRVAKKETEGTKWFWMSGPAAQEVDPSKLVSLEISFMSGSVVSMSVPASTSVGQIASQLKEEQSLVWIPQLLVGGRLLDCDASAGSSGSLSWSALVMEPRVVFSRWRNHMLQWREITVPLSTPYPGPLVVPVLFGEDRLVLSPPSGSRLTVIDEFWLVGAHEKSGDYDPRPSPQPPYCGLCRVPLPLPAGTKLRFHDFDGSVLVAVLDDPEPGDKRVDPQDNQAYTFGELSDYYKGQYSKKQLSDYWRRSCWPLEEVSLLKFRLCDAHTEDIGKVRWEPEGKVQHLSFDLSSWCAVDNFRWEHNVVGYKAPASGFHTRPIDSQDPIMKAGLTIHNDSDPDQEQVDVVVGQLYEGRLGVGLKHQSDTSVVMDIVVDDAHRLWKLGDEVKAVNGNAIRKEGDFLRLYGSAKESLPVTFTVVRAKAAGRLMAKFHCNHPELALDPDLVLLSGENAGEDAFYDMRLFDWRTGNLVNTIPLNFSMGCLECGWPRGFLLGSSQTFFTACSEDDSENSLVAFCTPI